MTESITAEDLAALVAIPEARDFATVTDGGVRGIVGDGHAFAARADERRGEGQTVVYLAVDGTAVAAIGIGDPIKATTAEAIAAMSLSSVSAIGNALRRRSQRMA